MNPKCSSNAAFLVSGYGVLTCREFLSNKQHNRSLYEASLQWIHGYLSGLCQAAHLFLGKSSIEGALEPELLHLWLEEFTEANPDSILNEAAARLYARFTNARQARIVH